MQTDLVLPWRPLYNVIEGIYFTSSRSRSYVDEKYHLKSATPGPAPLAVGG